MTLWPTERCSEPPPELHEYLLAERGGARAKDGFFLRAESFYNLSTDVDGLGYLDSYGGKSLHEQSQHHEQMLKMLLEPDPELSLEEEGGGRIERGHEN